MEKQSRNSRAAFLLITAAAVTVLSGCGAQVGDSVTAFDRDQVESDRLPEGVGEGLSEDSSRLLFTKGEVQYFASESNKKDEVCLVVYVPPKVWSSSCSPGLPITSYVDGSDEAQLNEMNVGVSSDTWNQVADNLALKK